MPGGRAGGHTGYHTIHTVTHHTDTHSFCISPVFSVRLPPFVCVSSVPNDSWQTTCHKSSLTLSLSPSLSVPSPIMYTHTHTHTHTHIDTHSSLSPPTTHTYTHTHSSLLLANVLKKPPSLSHTAFLDTEWFTWPVVLTFCSHITFCGSAALKYHFFLLLFFF